MIIIKHKINNQQIIIKVCIITLQMSKTVLKIIEWEIKVG